MALPTPLILLGIVGALLFATADKKENGKLSKKKPGEGGTLPTGFPSEEPLPGQDFPFGHCLDDDMPPQMKAEVNEILSTVTNPDAIDQAAQAAALGGFPKAAACLKQKAAQLRGEQGGSAPVTGGNLPFTVRTGDYPYGLATYYTGQGARYKELEPLNPQLGPMITRQGPSGAYSIYKNWAPGLAIQLPASWKPWDKPLPVPGTQTPSDVMPG